jgi:hypothetical protein
MRTKLRIGNPTNVIGAGIHAEPLGSKLSDGALHATRVGQGIRPIECPQCLGAVAAAQG